MNDDRRGNTVISARFSALLVAGAALLTASCSDDPAASSAQSDPCENRCILGFEECNAVSGLCEPLTGGADLSGPDAGDASLDLADAGSGSMDADTREDIQPDQVEVDRSREDTREPDLGPDSADTADAADVGESDVGHVDQGNDVQTNRLCPDRLEAHDFNGSSFLDNDASERATPLHETSIVGQLSACTPRSECPEDCAVSEGVCTEVTSALCGCCECDVDDDLASCGALGSDPDYYVFALLLGDPATVRVHVPRGTPRGDLLVSVTDPNGGLHLGVPGGSGGQPFFEIALTGGFADLDTGVTRNYLLRVESIAPFTTIPYWLEVEVDPYSRGCPGDPWDENWADYDRDDVSETSCSDGECAVALSTGEDALPTRAQICPWDHGDVFFHEISAGANRSIRVAYDHTATTHIAAVLYHDQDGDLVEIGEVCPEAERGSSDCDDSPGIIEGEFDDLVAGDYQLRVWSEDPAPNEVSVFFFE